MRPANVANFVRAMTPRPVKSAIKRTLGLPQTRLHEHFKILSPIGPLYRPHTVLDIGAHHGWFLHCWLEWCPDATVHAFEPTPASCEVLREKYGRDARLKINDLGVGDSKSTLVLHRLTKGEWCNSFLVARPDTWQHIGGVPGPMISVEVKVTTADAYCVEHRIGHIFLMKIDVQGFELKVLQGAEAVLSSTDYVFVEAGIVPLYEDAPIFTDVFHYMVNRGFHLMDWRAWHSEDHRLMESDMLFRRNDLCPLALDHDV